MSASDLPPIRILLPSPPRTAERAWGDHYFAHSLGQALTALGCRVRYTYAPRKRRYFLGPLLERLRHPREIELIIRGQKKHPPLPWKTSVMWVISCSDSLRRRELRRQAHVFVASRPHHARLAGLCRSASVLLQCTDSTRFEPGPEPVSDRLLFVGNVRKYAPRPIVEAALRGDYRLEIWGRGWKDRVPADQYAGLHIENDALAAHYRTAAVVLNDHTSDMRRDGFVSNRVYDVLACARPIVTEDMPGIPDDLRPGLALYSRAEDVPAAIRHAQDLGRGDPGPRRTLAAHVRQHHSFDARARAIVEILHRLHAPARPAPPSDPTSGDTHG